MSQGKENPEASYEKKSGYNTKAGSDDEETKSQEKEGIPISILDTRIFNKNIIFLNKISERRIKRKMGE